MSTWMVENWSCHLPNKKQAVGSIKRRLEKNLKRTCEFQQKTPPGKDKSQVMLTAERKWQGEAEMMQGNGGLVSWREALWGGPATSHLNPFIKTAALLALDIHNIGIAAAAAANTVLLDGVRSGPVLIFLNALLLVFGGLFKVRLARQLPGGSVSWAMLDGGVPISKVTEVMDVTGSEKSTGGKRMNGSITPLSKKQSVLSIPKKAAVIADSTHSFIPESTTAVHHVEKVLVRLAAEPIQARNFEVTPEMTHVVTFAFHGLGVDVIKVLVTGFGQENLIGKLLLLLLRLGRLLLLGGALEEHLPQAL